MKVTWEMRQALRQWYENGAIAEAAEREYFKSRRENP